MSLDLTEYTINTEDVIEDIIEKDKGYIQFFFVEYTQACLGIFPKGCSVNRNIVLGRE